VKDLRQMSVVMKPKIKFVGNYWKCYSLDRVAYGETPKAAWVNWVSQYF